MIPYMNSLSEAGVRLKYGECAKSDKITVCGFDPSKLFGLRSGRFPFELFISPVKEDKNLSVELKERANYLSCDFGAKCARLSTQGALTLGGQGAFYTVYYTRKALIDRVSNDELYKPIAELIAKSKDTHLRLEDFFQLSGFETKGNLFDS